MITALRGYAPQASSIRNAKRLLSPLTLRRYRRFNCDFSRPYSTEHGLENGPAAPTEIQCEEQKHTIVRGGYGDEGQDIPEDSHPTRAAKEGRAAGKYQFEGLRQVEPAKSGIPSSKTSLEAEQQYFKEDSYASDPWISTLGEEPSETASPPENSSKRTAQEDVTSLCTYTPWGTQAKFGYLQRGFEFSDFRSARSFIIEAMNLNDSLKAHLSLSNFGRFVYTRIGSPNDDASFWSISEEDVDLAWALQKAAKKYLGRWQMDAAAQPMGDLGYTSSWRMTSKIIVTVSGRWHHLLDLRRPPMGWLTMEYRQISQLGITASEVVEALVNQIAEDLVKKDKEEQEVAFPVWCITDQTLAVSQTEFFSTSASTTKPGNGRLTNRETVILHRNFNLEQFNSMVAKEQTSLKSVADAPQVAFLLKSVTSSWFLTTMEPKFGPMNTSAQDVYLKEWGPIMTKELQPLVRRVLGKEIKEHSAHVQALPDIYSKEKVLAALDEQGSTEERDWREAHAAAIEPSNKERRTEKKMRYEALNREREQRLKSRQSSQQNAWIPKGFGTLVHMLRENLDDDGKTKESIVQRVEPPTVATDVTEDTRWREHYFNLRRSVEEMQRKTQSRGSSSNAALVDLLSRVGFRDEPIDWRARYYELRRSANSLGLVSSIHAVRDAADFARQKGKEEAAMKNSRKLGVHWDSEKGFSKTGQGVNIKHHEAMGKYTWWQAEQNDAASQLDEEGYADVLGSYTANRRAPNKPKDDPEATVFYHWMPGEKLGLNDPAAIEANIEQAWRPEQWKNKYARFSGDRGVSPKGNPDPLTHSPRPEQDASPLTAHRDPNDPYVRPIENNTLSLHWLPGDSLLRDKDGHIIPPPRVENAKEELEAKRQRLIDWELLEAQQTASQKPLGTSRMVHDSSGGLSFFGGEADDEAEREAAHFMQTAHEQYAARKSEPQETRADVDQTDSTEVETSSAQPEHPQESLLSVEDEARNGHLNDADAEKLLSEVGIDMEQSQGSETAAEGDVGRREGEAQGRESEEEKSKDTEPNRL